MAETGFSGAGGAIRRTRGVAMAAGCGLMLAACAQAGTTPSELLAKVAPAANATTTGSVATTTPADNGRTELAKATEYWGKAFAQNPRDAQTALNYARNLKAMGEKQQAFMVLQQAALHNGTHRGIAGEYGRLALEFDQVTMAEKLLDHADDPANPDWKVISARGTVFAKQGLYQKAVPLYERALALAPDQASVLSNLAMAHLMLGEPEKAEPLLKRAVASGRVDARLHQNLALALGVQGKYDEAKLIAARDLPPDRASANVDYMQKMVRLEPKPLTLAKATEKPAVEIKGAAAQTVVAPTGWSTQVAVAKK